MSAAVAPRITPEQYLALERASGTRNEFFSGGIRAMAGASRLHNLITGNLHGEIRTQLKGRPCEVYATDMRVCVSPTGMYTYPDIAVVCGEARFLDEELDTLLNPTVLIEILSPSTEADDRGRKSSDYRRLASLAEYVLVAQDRARVEHFARRGEEWSMSELAADDAVLHLGSIGCAVPLREVYARTGVLGA